MAKNYLLKFLIAIDMLVATVIWRDADITISAYTGLTMRRAAPPWWAKALSATLDWIALNHCETAIANDLARAKAAIAILESK